MKRQQIVLRFDGLFKQVHSPNAKHQQTAGFLCYGWIITRNGKIVARGHGGYARRTYANSNVAEYLALIEGLEALQDMGVEEQTIRIMGDAKTVIDQMQGDAAVNAARLRPLHMRAMKLARNFRSLHWVWTPRRDNRAADSLTRRALRQIRADHEGYQAALQALTVEQQRRQRLALLPLLDLRIYQPAPLGELAL
jgi:ribonuclease HI